MAGTVQLDYSAIFIKNDIFLNIKVIIACSHNECYCSHQRNYNLCQSEISMAFHNRSMPREVLRLQ